MAPSPSTRNAWVQLYEARRATNSEFDARPPGRPPLPVPRTKVGFTLSTAEVNELSIWQDRLTELLGRKVSTGETIGILTRVCTARLNRLGEAGKVNELAQLVERMIGNE